MSSQYPVTMVSGPSAAPPVGFSPGTIPVPFVVRGGSAVSGDVYVQDFAGLAVIADSAVPTGGAASLGSVLSVWSNMAPCTLLAQSMAVPGPLVGVAKRNAADLDIVDFVLYGFVDAFCSRSASAAVAIGNALRLDDSAKDFVATHGSDSGGATLSRQPAVLQEATTLGTTRTLLECFVNGVSGVGTGFKTT